MVSLDQKFDCVVFDCDGVLWKGGSAIPGAAEALNALKYDGDGNVRKRLMYCTNNSSMTPTSIQEKLSLLGFPNAIEDDIITPATVLPGICEKYQDNNKKLLVCATEQLYNVFQEKQLDGMFKTVLNSKFLDEGFHDCLDDKVNIVTEEEFVDEEISVVILGYDHYFNWLKLAYVQRLAYLRSLKGMKTTIVHSNPDVNFPHSKGRLPGGGAFGAAYDACLSTNEYVETVYCGKPNKSMLGGIPDPKRSLMIGDNILTDIEFGKHFGGSVLVESGIHNRKDIGVVGTVKPTIVLEGVWDLKATTEF